MNTKNSPCNERFEPSFEKGLRDEWEKETWDAVISHQFTTNIHPTRAKIEKMEQMLRSSEIKTDTNKKFIGNDEGMTLLEEVRSLRSEVRLQRSEVQQQRSEVQQQRLRIDKLAAVEHDMISLRAVTLDEWTQQKNNNLQDVNHRNVTAHGGKITADITTIRTYSEIPRDKDRVTKWKEEFRLRYGVSYEDIETLIDGIPIQLLNVFDQRASVCSLDSWQGKYNRGRKRRIIRNADTIIQVWFTTGEELFREGSQTRELYNQITQDWIRGYYGAKTV